MSSSQFDPTIHGFVLLPDHQPAESLRFFELRNHENVDGSTNFHRLNYYLSQDGSFVNVWYGCLDSMILDVLFEGDDKDVDFDEPLFRGYIESKEQGQHILRALRLGSQSPQLLIKTPGGSVSCNALSPLASPKD